MHVRCAWCALLLRDKEPLDEDATSHGICPACLARLYASEAPGEPGPPGGHPPPGGGHAPCRQVGGCETGLGMMPRADGGSSPRAA